MTHQQKLQAVTEAIHKACPDLLELAIGSFISASLCEKGEPIADYHLNKFIISQEDIINLSASNGQIYITHCDKEYELYGILGQPIGIDSVLRAVGNKILLRVDTEGFFYTWELEDAKAGKYYCDTGAQWNLTKTLDQQEEPVIDLLHSVLCHDNN